MRLLVDRNRARAARARDRLHDLVVRGPDDRDRAVAAVRGVGEVLGRIVRDAVDALADRRGANDLAAVAVADDHGRALHIARRIAVPVLVVGIGPQRATVRRSLEDVARSARPLGVRVAVEATPGEAMTASSLVSSTLTKTRPRWSVAANSGLPPRSIVATTSPLFASKTVAFLPRPLKVKRCFECGS